MILSKSRLWKIIQDQDQSIPIAQLAADHYRAHGRPLRIAVDEADWRFHNLTAPQVYAIREKSNQPAFQGIEKAIFYRICRFLTLNIQLLFIFDGPKRPWKRGKPGGRIDYEKTRLLKELLRAFGIPYHEAPGEAEAECARLQQLGVVDAVFSQDSDSLMFGCDYLIRDDRVAKDAGSTDRSMENTRKSAKSIRVVKGEDIRLSHGDYDTKGLPGCGDVATMHAVKAGLGTSLCRCRTQADCMSWRESLVTLFSRSSRSRLITVPGNFPDIKTLKKYNDPTISTDEQLRNLRGLREDWGRAIDEKKLLEVTSTRFNIWGKLYMNWVGPILLTRFLAKSPVPMNSAIVLDNPHMVRLTRRRANKDDSPPFERKLTFSPFALTTLTRGDFDGGERTGYWTGAMDVPFDPTHRVECEIPDHLLQKGLPPEVLNPPSSSRKRKQQDAAQEVFSNPAPKRPRKENVASGFSSPVRRGNLASGAHISELLSDPEWDSGSDADILAPLNFDLARRSQNSRQISLSDRIAPHTIKTNTFDNSNPIQLEDDDLEIQEALRRSLEDLSPMPSGRFTDEVENHNHPNHFITAWSDLAGLPHSKRGGLVPSTDTRHKPALPYLSPSSGHLTVPGSTRSELCQAITPSSSLAGLRGRNDTPRQQKGSTPVVGSPSSKSYTPRVEHRASPSAAAAPRTTEQIRAARVQHFSSPRSTKRKGAGAQIIGSRTSEGPKAAGIECIDLTSD
jgi:Holliday junction resolvase YEN1